MRGKTIAVVRHAQEELKRLSNPDKAESMQAYMKTDMPFYGVQKPARTQILRHLKTELAPVDREEYEEMVAALWELTHREEKYLALAVAGAFGEFIVVESLPLYRRLIIEGAWWDFVDDVAMHMIRQLVLGDPGEIWPTIEEWNGDEDLWLRRTSIICQVGAKDRTDSDRLFRFCEARLAEREFFIRKAIGWALRDYAKTDPSAVVVFATAHRAELSGLSFREATKQIRHLVSG